MKELLVAGRLVERRGDTKEGIGITQAGFTFLLQEANAQVWTLLLLWLESADASGGKPAWIASTCFPSCSCLPALSWVGPTTRMP